MPGIERTLHMVKVEAFTADGDRVANALEPWDALAAMARDDRRLPAVHDEYVAEIDMRSGGGKGVFSKVRMNDHPKRHRLADGRRDELPIADDEGLDYPCHFTLWDLSRLPPTIARPEACAILVWEGNGLSARYTTFENYLNQVLYEEYVVKLTAVCREDPMTALGGQQVWGKVTVQVGQSEAARRALGDGWAGMLGRAPDGTRAIEVTFKPERGEGFDRDDVQRLVRDLRRAGNRAFVQSLKVSGERGQILDMLEGMMRVRVELRPDAEGGAATRSRAVDRGDAHAQLDAYFASVREELMAIHGRRWVTPPRRG